MNLKAAIYVRVSTDEQRDYGYSIDNQLRNVEEYCKRNNYDIVEVYNDAGHSGKDLFRPAMQKLLKDIKNGVVDRLVAIKVDRLTRNGYDGYWLLNYCNEHNVKIELSLEQFDVTTANGEMFYGMNLIFGQRERKEIGARTRRGLEEMALQHIHPNRAPYGYVKDGEGKLQVDPITSEVVKEIYNLCSVGKSLRKIADILQKENRYLKMGKWTDDRVLSILSNPIYNGTYYHGRTSRKKDDILVIKDYCPKIIDAKLYKEAMRGLENNRHSNYGEHIHLFSSIIKCPSCGKIMSSTMTFKRNRNGSRKVYYFVECKNKSCKLKGKNYNTEKIETKLIKMLNELMVYSIMNDRIITMPSQNNKEELKSIQKAIDSLSSQQKKLVDLYINSSLNVDVINEKNKMIKSELEKLKRKEDNLTKNQVIKFNTNLLDIFNKKEVNLNIPLPNLWNMLKRNIKREIIKKYILNIEVKIDSKNDIEITSINFNNEFLQNSIFNFTTHIMNSMSEEFKGIEFGKILTEDNIIETVKDNKIMSIYELNLEELEKIEEISRSYNKTNIVLSPYMINNEIIDYKIIIPDNDYT